MKIVHVNLDGMKVDFDMAKAMTKTLAMIHNQDTDLLAWHDRNKNTQSPSLKHCDSEEFKGWEEYGRHHGGRFEFRVNNGEYTMIYS